MWHDSDGDRAGRCLEVEKVVEWVCAGDGVGSLVLTDFPGSKGAVDGEGRCVGAL